MRRISPLLLLGSSLLFACSQQAADKPAAAKAEPEAAPTAGSSAVLDQKVKLLDGSDKSLSDYRGKTLLVVNVASQCGFTPQYAQLQELYGKYKDKGFEVLAFPSNDFGEQEPGTPEEIQAFVDQEFSVEFEMFEKVATKGPDQSPVYAMLTESTGEGIEGEIQWNFTKFLVDKDGKVVKRFEPPVSPTDPELVAALEALL